MRVRVRARVAISLLAKSSFQKAFVSHCMEFLAVFHSQCLSVGIRLEAEQRNRVQFLVLLQGAGRCCVPERAGAELLKTLLFIQRKTEAQVSEAAF